MNIYRIILAILVLILSLALIFWFFSNIVLYVLISLVISSVIKPVTDYIDNINIFGFRVPRIVAVFVSFIILATIPLVFILMFVPLILDQIQVLQGMDYFSLLENIQKPISSIEDFIINQLDYDRRKGFILEDTQNYLVKFIEDLQIGSILSYLLNFTGTILIYLLAVSFITFFLLYEKGIIRRTILSLVPNAYFEVVITTMYKIEKRLSSYLAGLLIQVTIMFAIIAIGLSIVGTKYALTIAAIAAVLNLIPYLGPVLGFLFAIFVIFSTKTIDGHWLEYTIIAVKTIPVFAIAQLTDNLFLQPFIFSKSVKAHPLEIFLAIFAGANLAGGLGMIMAIPTYTVIRVAFVELKNSYWQYQIFRQGKN